MPACIIVVEGLAGAGKTNFLTFLRSSALAAKYRLYIIESPLEAWQNVDNVDLLHAFHSNPERFAFAFLSFVLTSRVATLQTHVYAHAGTSTPPTIFFVERCILTDIECWGKTLLANAIITPWEMNILRQTYELLLARMPPVHGCIFLTARVERTLRCIKARRRDAESNILTSRFQLELDTAYRRWLQALTIPSLTIDTISLHQQPSSYVSSMHILREIDNFIQRIHEQSMTSSSFNTLSDDESESELEAETSS